MIWVHVSPTTPTCTITGRVVVPARTVTVCTPPVVVTADVGTDTPVAVPVTMPTDPMAPLRSDAASGGSEMTTPKLVAVVVVVGTVAIDTTLPPTGAADPSAVTVAGMPTFTFGMSSTLTLVVASNPPAPCTTIVWVV